MVRNTGTQRGTKFGFYALASTLQLCQMLRFALCVWLVGAADTCCIAGTLGPVFPQDAGPVSVILNILLDNSNGKKIRVRRA